MRYHWGMVMVGWEVGFEGLERGVGGRKGMMWEKGVRESTGEMGRKERTTKIRLGIKGGGVGDMGRRVGRCTKRNLKWVKTREERKRWKREGT